MTHEQHIDALKRLNLTHTLVLSTLTLARTAEEVSEAGALLDLIDLATTWAGRTRRRGMDAEAAAGKVVVIPYELLSICAAVVS